MAITTAGWDRNSICYEQHKRARAVLEGSIQDPTFFAYIRCCDEAAGDDWQDPEVWRKANPSLGVTISEKSFQADFDEAVSSPVKENAFKRYRLNIWTEQDVRWLQMAKWDACESEYDDLSFEELEEKLSGRECWGGLDLASVSDLSALALVFPEGDGFICLPYFWIPSDSAHERERRDGVPYITWARQGYLRMTTGADKTTTDFDTIRRDINAIGERFRVKEIAVDRFNAAQIMQQLSGDGFEIVKFGQGMVSMNEPCKELERLVISKRFLHLKNPIMRWMAGNVTVTTDAAGNQKPDKAKSTEKIDGIVAAVMAIGRTLVYEGPESPPEFFTLG